MTDFTNILTNLNTLFWRALLILLVILILILLILYLTKYRRSSIIKSLTLANSLKVEHIREHDPLADSINQCVRWTTVKYIKNREGVIIKIPTSKIFSVITKSNVQTEIKKKLLSEEFREVLQEMFPKYKFEAKPKYSKNSYILKGSKF